MASRQKNSSKQNKQAAARRIRERKSGNNSDNPLVKNAQVAELASQMYSTNSWRGLSGMRERSMKVGYHTLKKMSENNYAASFCIQHRCRQMGAFCKIAVEESDRGYRILPRETAEGSDAEKRKRSKILENFILNTGFVNDPDLTYPSRYQDPNAEDREDTFSAFVQYIVRDMLVYDQNTAEVRYTNAGDVYDFWYVDPITIVRTQPDNNQYPDGIKFVQMDKTRTVSTDTKKGIIAMYTADQLIFDYSNKRSQLEYRGYGYSLLEMAIDVTTVLLFAQAYNKDLFIKEKIPKGFLKLLGDADQKTLNAVRSYWMAEMSGYGAKFAIPIIPSGKDGMGMEWESLGQSNREMEYHQLWLLELSIFGAIFGLDLAEVGIKTDNSTAIIGESGEPRIQASKDAGLGSILAYVENYINRILAKVDDDYVFRFVGIKDEDRKAVAAAVKAELETFKTINEIRKEKGLDPIKDDYANVVLNPQAVQIYQASQQQDMGEDFGEDIFEEEAEGVEEEEIPSEEEDRMLEVNEKETTPSEKPGRFEREEEGSRFSKAKKKKDFISITI